jgi:N-acetylglucosamine-6-sulfatase
MTLPAPSGTSAAGASASDGRPNVVVIETDDQAQASMRVMSTVNARIADRGVTFPNSFVNFSLCCPSRSTFLTGQYAHNHGVLNNGPPLGGFERFETLHGRNNLAVWLKRGGYYTALIGKYLNTYGHHNPTLVPPGWSAWHAAPDGGAGVVGNSQSVYDYTLTENGRLNYYGADPTEFKQDVLTAKAVDLIDRRAPKQQPFFLWLTYTAPHNAGPDPNPNPPSDCVDAAKPPPRYADAFDSAPLPMPPSFNEADVSDKPQQIRDLPPLDATAIDDLTRVYRCQLESLLSVDDGVGQVLDALKAARELDNTYVIYTSDNGYFHGEHRVRSGKGKPYEPSIRVPLLIRGPGIPRGVEARDLAINADLAPTIVQATGVRPRLVMDGRSLLPSAMHPGVERGRELLIEAHGYFETQGFRGIRTQRYIYVEYFNGEKELYDLKLDPNELQSVDADPSYARVRRHLAQRLKKLRRCAGRTCHLRPRLGLAFTYRSATRAGEPCADPPVRAQVRGHDARNVVEARFYVDGRLVGVATRQPLRRRLPSRRLDRGGRTRVRVTASLVDGRRMTIDRSLRVCG